MRGWTARVGLRKPGTLAWARSQLGYPHLTSDEWDEFIEYQAAHLTPAQVNAFQPWVNAEWADALLGQMRWPGDPDHVDNSSLDALVERQEAKRQMARALPLPVPKRREAATYELSDDARPCCHTTGPNHHPACQEAK